MLPLTTNISASVELKGLVHWMFFVFKILIIKPIVIMPGSNKHDFKGNISLFTDIMQNTLTEEVDEVRQF